MIVDEVSSHREASPADWQTQFPDYIDFVTKAPLLADDQEEWNKRLDEIKTKYGKETED